jgi:hypothetical protein
MEHRHIDIRYDQLHLPDDARVLPNLAILFTDNPGLYDKRVGEMGQSVPHLQ